ATKAGWATVAPHLDQICTVIANGVDLSKFKPTPIHERLLKRMQTGLPANKPVLLYVGRIAPEKGVLDLVAAHTGSALSLDSHLAIVGSSSTMAERRYEASVRAAAAGSVTF